MKKIMTILTVMGLCFSLCACDAKENRGDGGENQVSEQGEAGKKGTGQENSGQKNTAGENTGEQGTDGLYFVCRSDDQTGCYTEDGYYYLTEETEELRDGSYGMHLMYMDFASQQEVYLCSNTACNHDTPDCTSVFLYEDFPVGSTRIFVYKDMLYILSKEYDEDGTVTSDLILGDSGGEIESSPAVLYRANLDGTDREKVYTFDSGVTVEDFVLGDSSGIYLVTKKMEASKNGSSTYTTSTDRNLIFVDVEKGAETKVCSMDLNNDISWNVRGCFDNKLVLEGVDYGKKLSTEEIMDDDGWKERYENSSEVYALLDIDSGAYEEVYRISNQELNSSEMKGNMMYVSNSETGDILSIDLLTGEEKTLCNLPQNSICDMIGDKLCCHDWNWTNDYTFYYVDVNTGEISHSSLVNKALGWSLEFRAELADDVLVIYDYDYTPSELQDDSYEINCYKYALISKEDLYAGVENYRPIQMIGKGQ